MPSQKLTSDGAQMDLGAVVGHGREANVVAVEAESALAVD
jgi:hypothetical protein